MSQVFNTKYSTPNRKQLRNNLAAPEAILWSKLSRKQLGGFKFRRQHGIGRYVADFFCSEVRLVVEIDGESHFTDEAKAYDKEREEYFKSLDLHIIRFTNNEVRKNLTGVLNHLLQETQRLKSTTPAPPR